MEALMQNLQGHPGYNPDCPLVADVSSNILSRPVAVARYGILYGGAQKNVGSAGVTLVVVHNSLLPRALPFCPSAFEFKTVAANGSMYNTPPTYAIYIAGLVFEWLLKQGGVAWAEQHAQRKSQLLYQCIDQSHLYYCQVKPQDRSRMNVSFRLRNTELEPLFLEKAKQRGLVHLKGHKLVGGMRASIYNAMPLEGVQALVAFMHDFERHGDKA
jgi:phosphoserine aminotransferase